MISSVTDNTLDLMLLPIASLIHVLVITDWIQSQTVLLFSTQSRAGKRNKGWYSELVCSMVGQLKCEDQ